MALTLPSNAQIGSGYMFTCLVDVDYDQKVDWPIQCQKRKIVTRHLIDEWNVRQ